MGIVELLRRVGEDNVRVQNILEGDVDVTAVKGGTRVTFYTDSANLTPGAVLRGRPPMVGLVVWMPRALVDAALASSAVGRAQEDGHGA